MRIFGALLILFSSLACAGAQSTQRMDAVVSYYYSQHQFMGSVLLAKGDQALFSKSYGYADLEWQNTFTPDTKFRIGSITKQFTAACILLLQEEGKLKTSDPVSRFVPNAPAAWKDITLRNLLTHTSGIHNYTDLPDFPKKMALPAKPEEIVAPILTMPLDFAPGEKFSYSNTNYIILGMVVEKASGKPYAEFLQERIFRPLGMNDSGYETPKVVAHRATGYVYKKAVMMDAEPIDMTVPFAAGALYSTPDDLRKWSRGVFRGHLLKPESLEEMTTPFKENYGYGVEVVTKDGHKNISHGGGINGFNSSLVYLPQEDVTIVALSNVNGGGPDAITANFVKLFYGAPVILPNERTEVAVPTEKLQRWTGDYQTTLDPSITLKISLKDGHLMATLADQPTVELHPETDSRFFTKEADSVVEFSRAPDGIVSISQTQGTLKIPWTKKR